MRGPLARRVRSVCARDGADSLPLRVARAHTQSIIIFLQSLPTQDWTDKDTELLLSEAFLWSRTFQAR